MILPVPFQQVSSLSTEHFSLHFDFQLSFPFLPGHTDVSKDPRLKFEARAASKQQEEIKAYFYG